METIPSHNQKLTGSIETSDTHHFEELDEPYTGNDYLRIIDSQRDRLRAVHALVLTLKQRNDELLSRIEQSETEKFELSQRVRELQNKLLIMGAKLTDLI